ncbi:hypothetical protein XENTR_v10020046 [Xenopus tropicalis]|nr:hypothetical protein XENTR_v10020046 [Xenopus tropicalis]
MNSYTLGVTDTATPPYPTHQSASIPTIFQIKSRKYKHNKEFKMKSKKGLLCKVGGGVSKELAAILGVRGFNKGKVKCHLILVQSFWNQDKSDLGVSCIRPRKGLNLIYRESRMKPIKG